LHKHFLKLIGNFIKRKVKNKKLHKAAANNLHFKRRMLQRYGLVINQKIRREIIDTIKAQKSEFLERLSGTRTLHKLNIEGREIKVVYDSRHENMVTALK